MNDRMSRPQSQPTPGPEAPSLPEHPRALTGREIYRLPEGRTRGDGGPIFDAVEVAPVVVLDADGTCESFEDLADIPEELQGTVFWSLYGHTPGEGVLCLGDYQTADDALEALARLFGDLPDL